tara:strand:+ start:285 stop:587 length:303 start_codon:yes stop_codon:yes gene_type:complete
METIERILYARQCDITGEGMNEGYCIQDGLMYIKHKKDMIKHLRGIENVVVRDKYESYEFTDDNLMSVYYEEDYYYWTEWECEDDLQYEEVNGELIELED